jgi:hypothetical protein
MILAELKVNIAKLEKGLSNSKIAQDLKPGMRKKLAQLQVKLAEMEAEEMSSQSNENASSSASEADSIKPENKEPAKKKLKQKVTGENKEKVKSDCQAIIIELKGLLNKYNTDKVPTAKRSGKSPAKKRASEVLADGISGVIGRVVKRELTLDKVTKIKTAKLRDARDKFSEGLKALRSALGGISSDNDTFIEDFKKEINELIEQVEEKQKVVEEKQAA